MINMGRGEMRETKREGGIRSDKRREKERPGRNSSEE